MGWRNSAVGASRYHVPGDPQGLETISAQAWFYWWIEDGCFKGKPSWNMTLAQGQGHPSCRCLAVWPELPGFGAVAGTRRGAVPASRGVRPRSREKLSLLLLQCSVVIRHQLELVSRLQTVSWLGLSLEALSSVTSQH